MNTNSKLPVLAITIFFVISCTLPNSPSTPTADYQTPNTGIDALPTMTTLLDVLPTMTSPSEASPTASPITEQTSTIVILPTNLTPYVYASQNTNCRKGPDVIYEVVGYLLKGEISEIVARNPQGTWVAIKNLDAPGICYVSLSVVEVNGIESIMLVITVFTPPPPPTLTSTSLPSTFTSTSPPSQPTITYTPELPTAPSPGDPHVDVSPPSGPIPTRYSLKIFDFDPGEVVTMKIICICGGSHTVVDQFQVTMDGNGNFTTSWTSESGDPTGGYYVQAIGGNGKNNAVTEFSVE